MATRTVRCPTVLGFVVLVVALAVAILGGAAYRRLNGTVRVVAPATGTATTAANAATTAATTAANAAGTATTAANAAGTAPTATTATSATTDVLRSLVGDPGERATLVQFSSAFCTPCRATRRILTEVAAVVPGVRHVEIDAESHLAEIRALDIRRTPTTLIVGPQLQVLARASGQPRRDEVLATLAGTLPGPVT